MVYQAPWGNYPKKGDDSDATKELKKRARKKGLPLPAWMQYKLVPNFDYVGVGYHEDEADPDLEYDDRRSNRKRVKRMKDKDRAKKINKEIKEQPYGVYLASGVEHPLPETNAQKKMMERGTNWGREGPLLPKNPMETPSELRNSAVGKRARKKLEAMCAEIAGKDDAREKFSTVLMVSRPPKKYQWACYVGDVKTSTKGTGLYRDKRAAPKSYQRRDYTIEKTAIKMVSCPTCKQEKEEVCINKRGEKLPLKKTHERRITKYYTEIEGKDLSDVEGNKKQTRLGHANY